MGEHLRRRFGDDYYAIGYVFDQGSTRAYQREDTERPWRLRIFDLGAAPPGSFGHAFGMADAGPAFFLDLRTLRKSDFAGPASWLARPRTARQLGAFFSSEASTRQAMVLPDHYDAVIFFRRITPSTPLPRLEKPEKSGG